MSAKLIFAVTGLVAASYATTYEHPHTPENSDHRAVTGLLTFEKYSDRIRNSAPERFDADRVLANFRKLDTSGDGIVDAPERRAARAERNAALIAMRRQAEEQTGSESRPEATN